MADLWRARGWQVTIHPTNAPGHATELASLAAISNHRVVIAAGGDGTLGEVASGLAGTETAMAPLPVGTANSFARELLMPRPGLFEKHKLLTAAESLLDGVVQPMDLGYQIYPNNNGRNWLLWAGTGADGYLVDRVEPRPTWSKRMGRLGYFLQSLSVANSVPSMYAKVTVDGRVFEDEYVLVLISNCRLYAGGQIMLNPQAKLDDGQMEIWLFSGDGLFDTMQYLVEAKLERHHNNPNVTQVNGHEFVIETDPTFPCQTDGDKAGNTPFHCQVKTRTLRLLVPNTAPADLFSMPGESL